MSSDDPERLNKFPKFTAAQADQLQEAALKFPLAAFLANYRNVEEIGIDFVYSSAKLEGNTYSRVDTLNLLKIVSDVHSILSKDLLPASNCGIPREGSVRISGTDYSPPVGKDYLNEELKYLLDVAHTLEDPFERAIYLKLNLCYLQYFQDVNKRTARMVQTFSMLNTGVMPLLAGYVKSSGYIEAILSYYNTGSYTEYMSWFVSSYIQMVQSLTEQPKITKSRSADLRNKNN